MRALKLVALAAALVVGVMNTATSAQEGYDWTGFYAGVVGGYGLEATSSSTNPINPGSPFLVCFTAGACPTDAAYGTSGLIGGVQVGGDRQFDSLVVGFVGDVSLSRMTGNGVVMQDNLPGPFFPFESTSSSTYDWFSTFRGRIGHAMDRFLVYGTGGLVVASVTDTINYGFPGIVPPLPQFFAGNQTSLLAGLTVGVGGNYAVTDQLVIGAEVLYYKLSDHRIVPAYNAPLNPDDGIATIVQHGGFLVRGNALVKF
jgi:outer membrane immunogenic protein